MARAGTLHLLGFCLHLDCGVPLLFDAIAGDSLARLDDRPLPEAMAVKPCVLPARVGALHAVSDRARGPAGRAAVHARQPGPAHSRRLEPVHQLHRVFEHGAAERGGDAAEFCRHFVESVRGFCLHARRHGLQHSRLHGLDGGAVLRGGQRHHALHRSAANTAEFFAATLRSRLSAPHGAGA